MTAFAVSSALGSTGSEQSTGISSGVMTRKTPILAAVGPCPQSVLVNPEPTVRCATSWPRTNAEQGANAQAADGDSADEKAVDRRSRQMRQPMMSCAVTADTAFPRPRNALPMPMHHTLACTPSLTAFHVEVTHHPLDRYPFFYDMSTKVTHVTFLRTERSNPFGAREPR
jgi:hypothetical protein